MSENLSSEAAVTASRSIDAPGVRYFDVRMPGYAAGNECDEDQSVFVSANNPYDVVPVIPHGCDVVELSTPPDPSDVHYHLPRDARALHEAAIRIGINGMEADVVAKGIADALASLESCLTTFGTQMSPSDAAAREQVLLNGRAQLYAYLRMRTQVLEHDKQLDADEVSPTGDDYNHVVSFILAA